ncbi:acyl-CoA thioesterase-1 [Rhizobiales bacterium GAS188]|nr:acyl-CoA thioesterase-1 [Rhizobiales bacterium GAS188]
MDIKTRSRAARSAFCSYGARSDGGELRRNQGAGPSRRALIAAAAAFITLSRRAAADAPLRLVALGDSLTAGPGLSSQESFPQVLQRQLAGKGLSVAIANAGVSGDTAEDGLQRLDWSVPKETQGVILELGANDALRGLDPKRCEATLDEIVAKLQGRGTAVLLCGMYAPRNLGADYVGAFDGIYPRLSAKYGLTLYPFFLDGVTGHPKLTLPDGLHPNAEGVKVIVDKILPTVETFIGKLAAR